MIKNHNRAGWFGASDTKFIMGNWSTSTFMNWWMEKLGVKQNTLKTEAMIAGSYKEHQIAQYYAEQNNTNVILDRQVKIRKYRLRVNLDCETNAQIVEIKTHKLSEKEWKLPKEYVWQVQVQMFATKKHKACIYAYALNDDDYNNFYLPIEEERAKEFNVEYDEVWINNEYLPRLKYLASCLKKRKTPKKEEYEKCL